MRGTIWKGLNPTFSSANSPAEAMFVCRSVLLQQCSELKQGEFLEEIHLQHRLAADLEGSRGRTGSVGVLEARPAEFLRPGAQWDRNRVVRRMVILSWSLPASWHVPCFQCTQQHTMRGKVISLGITRIWKCTNPCPPSKCNTGSKQRRFHGNQATSIHHNYVTRNVSACFPVYTLLSPSDETLVGPHCFSFYCLTGLELFLTP